MTTPLCPSCRREPCAIDRKRCFVCLETELDAVKVNCEGRAKVTPYVPYDWTSKGQNGHDRNQAIRRKVSPVYRVDSRRGK